MSESTTIELVGATVVLVGILAILFVYWIWQPSTDYHFRIPTKATFDLRVVMEEPDWNWPPRIWDWQFEEWFDDDPEESANPDKFRPLVYTVNPSGLGSPQPAGYGSAPTQQEGTQ